MIQWAINPGDWKISSFYSNRKFLLQLLQLLGKTIQ